MERDLIATGFEPVLHKKLGGFFMAMAYLAKNWISDMIPGGRKSWRLEKTPHHDCEAISVHAAYNAIFILSWVRLAIDLVLPNSPSYFGAVMLAKLEK